MLENIHEAEQDQKIDFACIEAAVNVAQEHLSALLDRCPDEENSEWSAVRDRINRLLRDVRKRAKAADETRRRIIETFVRDDGPSLRGALLSMVADLPTEALVDHLRYCLRVGDLTHARQLAAALSAREDRELHMPSFEEALAEWLLYASGDDTLQRLVNICRLGEEAEARSELSLVRPGGEITNLRGCPTRKLLRRLKKNRMAALMRSRISSPWGPPIFLPERTN